MVIAKHSNHKLVKRSWHFFKLMAKMNLLEEEDDENLNLLC